MNYINISSSYFTAPSIVEYVEELAEPIFVLCLLNLLIESGKKNNTLVDVSELCKAQEQ